MSFTPIDGPEFATDNTKDLMTLTLDVSETLGVLVFPADGSGAMRFREPLTALERTAIIAHLREAILYVAGMS